MIKEYNNILLITDKLGSTIPEQHRYGWLKKNIRHISKKYFDVILPNDFNFHRTQMGKPYIPNSPIHFSISHKEKIGVLVVSKNNIGIDIENIVIFNTEIIPLFCNHKEQSYISTLKNDVDKNLSLYKIWTQKEAYIKKNNSSISNILRDIETPLSFEGYITSSLFPKCYVFSFVHDNTYFISISSLINTKTKIIS